MVLWVDGSKPIKEAPGRASIAERPCNCRMLGRASKCVKAYCVEPQPCFRYQTVESARLLLSSSMLPWQCQKATTRKDDVSRFCARPTSKDDKGSRLSGVAARGRPANCATARRDHASSGRSRRHVEHGWMFRNHDFVRDFRPISEPCSCCDVVATSEV